jgi:UDP-perosamine 4-acetyltransferase
MMQLIGLGAGGHAKVIIDIVQMTNDYELVGLLDSNPSLWGAKVYGIPVLGNDRLLPKLYEQNIQNAFIGLGSIGNTLP